MDGCGSCDSPRGSTDSLIEKVRLEVTKTTDEDLINIKKLSIQASNKSRESSESSCDIDKKISDLECLIKKLQDELNDLSCANKSPRPCGHAESEIDMFVPVMTDCKPDDTKVTTYLQENIEENICHNKKDSKEGKSEDLKINKSEKSLDSTSHRYPIILRDIDHVQNENLNDEKDLECDEETAKTLDENRCYLTDVKQNVLYGCEKDTNESNNEINQVIGTESITDMITELRAEIHDTIHTLNQNDFLPCESRKD